ncbi:hypothetical protein Bca4012_010389 [Brassica carinata]
MSGNMKEKVAVCVNDGKTTPAATVPTANAYANATRNRNEQGFYEKRHLTLRHGYLATGRTHLRYPLSLDQSGFRFVSIGVSVEILRREQNHSPGHLARGREQPSPRSPRPWPPRQWKPHFSLL